MIESITQSLMEKYYSLRSKEQSNKTLAANSSPSKSITSPQHDTLYTPNMKNIDVIQDSYAPFLQIDRNNNLLIEKNKVYSIKTDYGVINYKFHHNNDSRYVETLHFDNKISDEKRVHLERTRQFLTHLQTFAVTGRINIMYTARTAQEVLKGFERLGISTDVCSNLKLDHWSH
ncbi:hypothetical protein ACE1TI_21730 [Alteribacillus sp. JSM 102045]|uniref:hypothetical protein n=1 Tax=Alteribacillus sp. JSM 102045 TaxID=1562101 RepID=UPI0035C215E4